MIQTGKKTPLEQWIEEALNDPDKDGPCTAVSLVHCLATSGGVAREEVHSVKVGEKGYDPRVLAELFRHKATTYAQELTGVQSFMLLAFYGGKPGEQLDRQTEGARHPFRVNGETQLEGLATESPNETGKTAQNMRLTEAIVQGSFRQNTVTFDVAMKMLDRFSIALERSQDREWQAFEMVKQLVIEREANNHKYRLEEENRKMITKLVGYVPGLANQIAGKEIFPQSTVDGSILEQIAEDIANAPPGEQEQKVNMLRAVIPEKVWPVVVDRLAKILEAKKTNGMQKSTSTTELS